MGLRINGATSGYKEIISPAIADNGTVTLPLGNVTLASTLYVDNYPSLPRLVVTQNTSYTLNSNDAGEIILMNSSSANTLTIPTNTTATLANGITIDVIQYNTGQTTIAGAVGVTVNATPGLKLRARYSSCTLIKINTNEWIVVGDLSA